MAPASPTPEIQVQKGRIQLNERIRFALGKATLTPDGRELVRSIARAIAQVPETQKIIVVGHTDNRGARKRNLALSKRRAQAIVAALVRAGVARERLQAIGKGPDQPVADNRTRAGRAKNRRVEFLIENR